MKQRNLISYVRSQFEHCLSYRCSKGSCLLDLSRLSGNTVIVDCDKYKKSHKTEVPGKICDHFLFLAGGGTNVAVVEMKRGDADVASVAQLTSGQKIAGNIVEGFQITGRYSILLHGKGVKRVDLVKIRTRLAAHDPSWQTLLGNCGTSLVKAQDGSLALQMNK